MGAMGRVESSFDGRLDSFEDLEQLTRVPDDRALGDDSAPDDDRFFANHGPGDQLPGLLHQYDA